jgi:hypothetical protein
MDQNRKSRMEQAEGSRENVRGRGSSIGDHLKDTERPVGSDSEKSGGERGRGSSRERNRGNSSGERSSGITNRDLDTEQQELEQLPERGRSQSER